MKNVKLYTGTQHNQTINLWGEIATFDAEGVAEVKEETAKKAVLSVPHDYSIEPTKKKVGKVTSYTRVRSGDGVGLVAASVIEKEHKAKIEAQKKAAKTEDTKASKKTTKKIKKAKEEETVPAENSSDSSDNSEEKKPSDIWK